MRAAALVVVLFACRLPHVEPALRDDSAQLLTLAVVTSSCSEPDPLLSNPSVPNDATPRAFPIVWFPPHVATGVVISERHVLTAAHAVRCPALPSATIYVRGGEHRAVVERDDDMFPVGEPSDVARLELASAGGIGLGIAPPVVRDARGGEACCAQTLHGANCGTADPYHRGVLLASGLRLGDSGSPIYCSEALVGIVTKTGRDSAEYESIDNYWLEGT